MLRRYTSVTLLFTVLFFTLQSHSKVALYQEECGSCHMAYQPRLMATSSWEKLMSAKELSDHFGEDIMFEDQLILDGVNAYLVNNSFRYPANFPGKISTSIRITDMPSLARHHRRIQKKYITQKAVGSISNCAACHTEAEKGNYDERKIIIPGYGKYND